MIHSLLFIFLTASLSILPETVTLKAKNGWVTFDHYAHSERMKCSLCHGEEDPGKLDLDKDTAHTLCAGCHKEKGAGPIRCGECHKD